MWVLSFTQDQSCFTSELNSSLPPRPFVSLVLTKLQALRTLQSGFLEKASGEHILHLPSGQMFPCVG